MGVSVLVVAGGDRICLRLMVNLIRMSSLALVQELRVLRK